MTPLAYFLVCCAVAAGESAPKLRDRVMDGNLKDWGEVQPAYGVPGEPPANGPFALQRFEASGDDGRLWVALDFSRQLNLQAGPAWEGALCVEVLLPDSRRMAFDLRNRRIDLPGSAGSNAPRWTDINLISAPTAASDQFEIRCDLAGYVSPGQAVTVSVHAGTELAAPMTLVMGTPRAPAPVRSADRERGTCVRVANLNTHLDGLLDPKSEDALGRLITAVGPDVICFQEQWKTPAEDMARRLDELAPLGKAAWSVHKVDGCIIATHGNLQPVPSGDDRHAAAIVSVGPEPPMLVVCVHPKCCGYMGSNEDFQRIEQALKTARTVRELQASHPGIPVVVIGDWNLVGSDIPLDIVREAVDPEMARWPLRHLASTDEYTFFDVNGSFTPSTLDLVLHSPNMKRRNGFVLDTMTLPDETLQLLKLERTDSRASDHMIVVADFTLPD